MQYLRVLLVGVAFALLLVGCDGNGDEPPGMADDATDFRGFVTLVLALDANSEPVPVNDLAFAGQFAAGDPEPVDAFLP